MLKIVLFVGILFLLGILAAVVTIGAETEADPRPPNGGRQPPAGEPIQPRPRQQNDDSSCIRQSDENTSCTLVAGSDQADISTLKEGSALSGPLIQLVEADRQARSQGETIRSVDSELLPKTLRDLGTARLLRISYSGAVQVFLEVNGPTEAIVADVEDAGADIERVSSDLQVVQAWIHPDDLTSIAALSGVANIRLPDYGFAQAGSITTEGDAILNAGLVRSTYGVDGSGVRVGVISDGVKGLGASQASGDLPPTVDTTTCNVVAESPTATDAGAEGTAMLEIVHDLAPGAELLFGHFGLNYSGTLLDFMAAVNCLAANAEVVVDDIGFYNVGPYDGTSAVSANASVALNSGANPIRAYYNAVGNSALEHYEETYTDSGWVFEVFPDVWNLQHFTATTGTSDAGFGLPCSCADAVLLEPFGIFVARLQWNDPFGASSNDYDAFLFAADSLVAYSADAQDGNDDPVESFAYFNTSGDYQFADLVIGNYNGTAAARNFDVFLTCLGCVPLPDGFFGQPLHNFNTPCSSVPNNSDAGGGVVALAAIDAADPGWDDYEPFSSCGPTNDGRLKPDAAAIDGVAITGNGGFPVPFYGTSAAAPHAAGIAALLLDCNESLSRTQLRDALLNKAVDLGPPGTDYDFGHGRLNAASSAVSVGCAAATPVPSPTPLPTATPPPTPTSAVPPTATPTAPPGATALPTATSTATLPPAPTATRTPTAVPTPTTPAGLVGDPSCDGVINPIDGALILQFTAGLLSALPCPANADANDDGVVTVIDAQVILQFDAGFLPSLPP